MEKVALIHHIPAKVLETVIQVKITLFGNFLKGPASFQVFKDSDMVTSICISP